MLRAKNDIKNYPCSPESNGRGIIAFATGKKSFASGKASWRGIICTFLCEISLAPISARDTRDGGARCGDGGSGNGGGGC
ncbi:hypothetical protein V1478_008301 [Vespula squamosa]|uniref:Uncharacterized protein n=1 Tax=Vespula squamosa TaxID=30214 RepID=A0ABD2AYE0_VESSQ